MTIKESNSDFIVKLKFLLNKIIMIFISYKYIKCIVTDKYLIFITTYYKKKKRVICKFLSDKVGKQTKYVYTQQTSLGIILQGWYISALKFIKNYSLNYVAIATFWHIYYLYILFSDGSCQFYQLHLVIKNVFYRIIETKNLLHNFYLKKKNEHLNIFFWWI